MTDNPKPLPQLAGVHAYVPGEAPKNTGGKTYKLASNENPLGIPRWRRRSTPNSPPRWSFIPMAPRAS